MLDMYAGLDPYAIMGDLLSAPMTSKMRNSSDSPLYFLMEKEVIQRVAEKIGYPSDKASKSISVA